MQKIKAISCPKCGGPNANYLSAEKYQCQNCNVIYLIETPKVIETEPVLDFQKLNKMREHDTRRTLIILGVFVIPSLIIFIYSVWRR